jgi:putative transposase
MPEAYRHKETSVSLCNYHLIWCPKRRRKILVGPLKQRLETIIHEALAELDCQVLAIEIMPDHLHLFVSAPPQLSPTDIVARLKGRSSRLLRQEFPFLLKMPSLWTRSYFASTAGAVSSETIKIYIQNQRTRE